MTPEDRLRDALAAKARQFDADPGLAAGVEPLAVARQRRRRLQVVAGSALAAAAAIAVVFALAGGTSDENSDRVRAGQADTPTTDVSVEPSTSTTAAPVAVAPSTTAPTSPATQRPPFIVAADNKRIVVLNSTSGRVIRTLVELASSSEESECCGHIGDIALTPDGRHVLYEQSDNEGQIWRVPVSGGATEFVAARASGPAVSPDGTKLAYVREDALVVRDLVSSSERTFAAEDWYALSPRWAPDSRRVALDINAGESDRGVHVLDTATARSLDDAEPVAVPRTADRPSAVVGAWRGDTGELVAIRYCCYPEQHSTAELVAMMGARAVSTTPVDGPVFDLDYDRSGAFRLMVVRTGNLDELEGGGTELRWAGPDGSGTLGSWTRAAW